MKTVKYIGVMEMGHKRLELFNLLKPLDVYPMHSTLTRGTLEKLGVSLPPPNQLVVGEEY